MAKPNIHSFAKLTMRLVIVSLMLLNSACTVVMPFQREVLSKEQMQFDTEKVELGAREHFLNSLEGSAGGFGTGGGGCGCN